jgi:integrase
MGSTTVNLVLRQYERPDKTRIVNLRITHKRKIAYIPLNVNITADDWDKDSEQIDKKCKLYPNIDRVNNYLLQKKLDARKAVNDLYDSGKAEYTTVSQIKNLITNESKDITFKKFTEKLISELYQAKRVGNAIAYNTALNFVLKNNNEKDLYFQAINYEFLKKLEAAHLAKGNSINALGVYMRTIRAIYNRAIKENAAKREWYPFDLYSIKKTKTAKRAIKKEDILKIEVFNPDNGSYYFDCRNLFLFSFYLIGLNYTDMAYLTKENILNGRLEYYRKKTKKFYSIAISEKAMNILNLYSRGKKKNEFIFPVIKRKTPIDRRNDIVNALKIHNKRLGKMAKDLGIEGNITSYVARHSWASIGRMMDVPIDVISEALGHENVKTTQIYLESFERRVVDGASNLITG